MTGFGITLRNEIFLKIEFDVWFISSTIELTRVQVLVRLRALLWIEIRHFVYDRATPPIIKKLRSKGVAMHVYGVSSCILHVNRKSIKWHWWGYSK